MDIQQNEQDGITYLRFSGTMDIENYPVMKQAIAELNATEARNVIVNLSGVETISSSGVGALVHLASELKKRDGRLILAAPSKIVAEVLELLRLTTFFRITADEETARSEILA